MFRTLAVFAVALTVVTGGLRPSRANAEAPKPPMTIGSVDRKDPRFDALIPKDAKIEVLAGGFKWTEGPVWDKKTNALLFHRHPQ